MASGLAVGVWIYVAGALVVCLRLLWHIGLRLDAFDWEFHRARIWREFARSILLWPCVLVTTPRMLIAAGPLLTPIDGAASRARAEHQLRVDPPACAERVTYTPPRGGGIGVMQFRAQDLEDILVRTYGDQTGPAEAPDASGILHWLRSRSPAVAAPAPVPRGWRGFGLVANDALRLGLGRAHCPECQQDYAPRHLASSDADGVRSWPRDRVYCPRGHLLLDIEASRESLSAAQIR